MKANKDVHEERVPIPQEKETILELRNTSVKFNMERGESRVLNDVDLKVRRGETLGIVGESGSGKSMCASAMINAVVDPGTPTGEVVYYPKEDEPVNLLDENRDELKKYRWEKIAFLVQAAQSSFNPTMTIKDHFEETLEAHDYNIEKGLDRAKQLLTDLHLDDKQVFESHPHELSGGMQQRTLIALSLILEPEVLIMDEPTSALDLLMQRSIISLLANLKEQHDLTIVFVTHDLPIVADIADRISVMYAFEIIETGPSDQIRKNPAHPYSRLLLKSVPSLFTDVDEMETIDGSSPDPVSIPTGCSFHPRCPVADEHCSQDEPPFHKSGEDHYTACFYWEDARNEIPIEEARGER